MNEEDCIQCGRLTIEGSNLCVKCNLENEKYKEWKINFRSQKKKIDVF